jgi:hypothetical protein
VTAPGFAIFRDFSEGAVPYTGEMEASKFLAALHENSTPDLFEFGAEYVDSIFRFNKNTAFLMSKDTKAAYQSVFAQGAKNLKGKLQFSTSGENEAYLSMLGSFLNVQESDLP